jgi:hypothetical protein
VAVVIVIANMHLDFLNIVCARSRKGESESNEKNRYIFMEWSNSNVDRRLLNSL